MNKFRFAFQIFALVGLFFVFSTAANAQMARTWVSTIGDDFNPCSRAAPCKTFAGTIPKTSIGGEISCIDPGNYGAVTIIRSITIDCEDTQGAISASSGANAVILNLTDPADTAKNVRLRGLSINGFGVGTNGVRIVAGNKLVLEEIIIDGFMTHGVSILTTAAGNFSLVMKDTTVRNNGGNGINTFQIGAGTATVSVDNSLFAFNGVGFNQGALTTSTVQNSAFTNNTTGVQASTSSSILSLKDCVIAHNGTGVSALNSAVIRIGSNILSGNMTGLSGTNIFTWGGNFIDGNAVNGTNNGSVLSQ